jgi:hypothetical protein
VDNQSSYHIIEDFLTKEECAQFTEIVLANQEKDHDKYPLFDWMKMQNFSILGEIPRPWDPDVVFIKKLNEAIKISYTFFADNYKMSGTKFGLNRIHGNIMTTGASFETHVDEQPNEQGIYDGQKKTYVAALFLNDDYVDGEYYFKDQKAEFKPKAGSIVLFPGYCTPHEIRKITGGTRVNVLIVFYDYLKDNYEELLSYYASDDGKMVFSVDIEDEINQYYRRY